MTIHSIRKISTATVLGAALLFAAGCGGKSPPKSTTTTRTQTSTQQDSGERINTDVQEVKTDEANGTQNTKRTETTNTSMPAPR